MGRQWTLTVADGMLLGTAVELTVDVEAARLALSVPPAVVSGTSFALTVRAENAHGEVDTGYALPATSTAAVTASAGTLVEQSRSGVGVSLSLSGVADGTTVTLTVADGMLSATAVVSVDVVATRLALTVPPVVVSGTSFALTVRAENAIGELDVDYALSSTATVSASAGTLAEQSRSGAGVSLSLSGVADGTTVTLTVADGMLLGTAVELTVDVVATRLALTVPPVVVSGTSFALTVRAENALGELDVDYALSSTVAVTASAGTLVEQSRSGAGVSLSLSGVADGTTVTLTVADGMLLGTAVELTVDVVATRLALSVPPVVVSGTSFALTVRAENALGETDVDYALSSTAAVTASAGALVEQSRSGAGVSLSLSGVADGTTVTLTVGDGALAGSVVVAQSVVAARLELAASSAIAIVGSSFALTVRALDAVDTVVRNFSLDPSHVAAQAPGGGSEAAVAWAVSSTGTLSVRILRALDNSTVVLTVMAGGVSGSLPLAVAVEASRLVLASQAQLRSGAPFSLEVSGVDGLGNVDVDYALSLPSTVAVASSGVLAVVSGTTSSLTLRLSGVADGATVTLTVADGMLSGTVVVSVDVVATRIELPLLTRVVSGQAFALLVLGVNDAGERDWQYMLSPSSSYRVEPEPADVAVVDQPSVVDGSHLRMVANLAAGARDGARFVLRLFGGSLHNSHQLCDACDPVEGPSIVLDVVADRLALSVPTTVVAGTSFVLTVRGENASGEEDADYGLSSSVTLSVGQRELAVERLSADQLVASLSGVADGTTVTLTVADGMLSGTVVVSVDVVAARLAVSAPATVVVGTSFALTVRGENALGEVDEDYALPSAAVVTASAGVAVWAVSGADTLLVRIVRALDNSTVVLTVAADSLSGLSSLTASVSLSASVVATALRLSGPAQARADTSFTLTVRGVDAGGNVDEDFGLSAAATATVSSGVGRLSALSRLSASELRLELSGFAEATAPLQLRVLDQGLEGLFSLSAVVDDTPSLDVDLSGAVDAVDATLMLRALLLPDSIRDLLLAGNPSVAGLAVAGFPSLAAAEAAIVGRVLELMAHSSGVVDVDLSGAVDAVDATLMLRVLLLPDSIRDLLLSGNPSVAGLAVAGFPSLAAAEAAIVGRILERAGN